jgi:hypothetical protein
MLCRLCTNCDGFLINHRVHSARLSVQSSALGPPTPCPRKRVCLPPTWVLGGGETQSLAGEGVGGPYSDEGRDTLVSFVYYNHSTPSTHTLTIAGSVTINAKTTVHCSLQVPPWWCTDMAFFDGNFISRVKAIFIFQTNSSFVLQKAPEP